MSMPSTPSVYNPANWYWIVAGSTTQVYSSASASYVLISDTTYQAWRAQGLEYQPSRFATEQELIDYLAGRVPHAAPAGSSTDAAKTLRIQTQMGDTIFQTLLKVRVQSGVYAPRHSLCPVKLHGLRV